jgi:hypothetical protein
MKKYLILICFLAFTFSVSAQTTINTYTVWGDPATPPDDFVLSNGNGLIINDTLVIYGNLELKNDADIIINSGGVLIIVGDFIAKNNVDLAVGGVIVVTGVFDKTGPSGDLTDEGGDIFIFDDDPEWGPGATPVEGVDYGDEDDFINDPIFDIIGDLISAGCSLSLTLDNITDVTSPGGSDGAISITLTGTVDNFTWATNDGSGLVIGDEDQTGLTAGTYSVAAEGSNGGSTCFVFGSYTVVEVACTPPAANDQNPEVCSSVAGESASALVDLTLLEGAINGAGGMTYTWYSDVTLLDDITATANAQTIAKTINGGPISAIEDYYCLVSDGACTNVATITYLIYRTPETGPQQHIDDIWGN